MKVFITKICLLFFILILAYCIEGVIFDKIITPYLEHIGYLKLSASEYIRTEQGKTNDINTIFIEHNYIRLHTQHHLNETEALWCEEEGNTHCYLSAISACINTKSKLWSKLLYKGELPKASNMVIINSKLAKRLHIGLGDHIGIKTAISFDDFEVCGIIRNFYGLPEYDRSSSYYCLFDRNEEYRSKINGTYYTFSNNDKNAFLVENITQYLQVSLKIIIATFCILFFILVVLHTFVLNVLQVILTQRKYYNRLRLLGKTKLFVNKIIIQDEIFFSIISLLLSALFTMNMLCLTINFFSILLSVFVNYILLRKKIK